MAKGGQPGFSARERALRYSGPCPRPACPWAPVPGRENLSFGKHDASSLKCWRSLGRSCGSWEHKKVHFGVQAAIDLDFLWIWAPPILKACRVPLTKKVYLFMLVSRLPFRTILGSESACLRFEKQAFGVRGVTSWNSHDSRVR